MTLSLAVGAAIIWLVVGVTIGVISALKRGSFFDRAAMTFALAGVSLPIFWTGLVVAGLLQLPARLDAPRGDVHAPHARTR